jgi:tetratricopeptide (TPR) repeat protein
MIKKLLLLSYILLSCIFASAQEKETIYRSYIYNDMATWKKTIDAMHAEQNKNNERELELLNYEYGYIGWSIGSKRKGEAKIYLDRGLARIERLRKESYRVAVLDAYESAFLGFQIGLANLKAPRLGPRSLDFAKKSVEKDDNNALGYIQLGNIDFFMPPLFGGSKERAIEYYLKAEQLMLADGKGDWNYLALLVQLAEALEVTGKIDKAGAFYQKALSSEPNFSWVKDELYPAFTKKHKTK